MAAIWYWILSDPPPLFDVWFGKFRSGAMRNCVWTSEKSIWIEPKQLVVHSLVSLIFKSMLKMFWEIISSSSQVHSNVFRYIRVASFCTWIHWWTTSGCEFQENKKWRWSVSRMKKNQKRKWSHMKRNEKPREQRRQSPWGYLDTTLFLKGGGAQSRKPDVTTFTSLLVTFSTAAGDS